MSQAPRLIYRNSVHQLSIRVTSRTLAALANITATLRMESANPTQEVSASTGVRRAIEVYSESLYRLSGKRTLRKETASATSNTYANKKRK